MLASAGLLCLVETGRSGVFNLRDDMPLQQLAVYEWLSRRFERPMPASAEIDLNRKRGWTNKRVSNQRLRALGWRPRFASFLEAVEHSQLL